MQAHLCCVVCLLRCRAVLCLSRSRAVSKRSDSLCCWRASLLLSLSYCRLSSHVFCTSGRILWPGIVVSPLSLPSYCELCVSSSAPRRARAGGCVNSYTSVVNPLRTDIHTYIHTYKHNLRIRPHKHPPCPHDYVPHAKAFGN